MNALAFGYDIRSGWRGRVEKPASIGEKFLQTLDALSVIDPVLFVNWKLTDLRAKAALTLEESAV